MIVSPAAENCWIGLSTWVPDPPWSVSPGAPTTVWLPLAGTGNIGFVPSLMPSVTAEKPAGAPTRNCPPTGDAIFWYRPYLHAPLAALTPEGRRSRNHNLGSRSSLVTTVLRMFQVGTG